MFAIETSERQFRVGARRPRVVQPPERRHGIVGPGPASTGRSLSDHGGPQPIRNRPFDMASPVRRNSISASRRARDCLSVSPRSQEKRGSLPARGAGMRSRRITDTVRLPIRERD
jgi:hypothetical protein